MLRPCFAFKVLVAHGLETGTYFIPLSCTLGSPADFEKADDANTSAANPVRLTAALLTPAGGGASLRTCVQFF